MLVCFTGGVSTFAEKSIKGVEKSRQRFPGASRRNYQRMFASRRYIPGL